MGSRGAQCARPRRRLRVPVQLELPAPRTWGGRRVGAGRKAAGGRRNVTHRVRERHSKAHPVHVVLRSLVSSLRSQFIFPTVRSALAAATRARADFRVLHFSVQADHLHLIVEADSAAELSRGMQGLAVRVTRAVNRLVFRRGKLWSDRFFARDLTSPRAVRNAIGYVLNNFRKHREPVAGRVDPCASAVDSMRAGDHVPMSRACTWLARNSGCPA
jgi:REP element-mobilizing transposase RayT